MRWTVILVLVCVLSWVAPAEPTGAGESGPADPRIESLERRIAELEAQVAALQEKLAALQQERSDAPRMPLSWTTLRDREHLEARRTAAAKEEKPVVVFVRASWCKYSNAYRTLIDTDADLRRGFETLVRLEVDITEAERADLREALRVPFRVQPWFVFFDATGRRVPEAEIRYWRKEESAAALQKSLELVSRPVAR